jgi:hypothetical protein
MARLLRAARSRRARQSSDRRSAPARAHLSLPRARPSSSSRPVLPTQNLHAHPLTPDSIAAVFEQRGVPQALDFLSVDVDTVDLWLLRAILDGGFRPRVVSIEYNCNYALTSCVTLGWWAGSRGWSGEHAIFGTSLGAINALATECVRARARARACRRRRPAMLLETRARLGGQRPRPPLRSHGRRYGYALVANTYGLDAFLVDCGELAAGGFAPPKLSTFASLGVCIPASAGIGFDYREYAFADLMDYCVWRKTGDIAAAIAAARTAIEDAAPCPILVSSVP